MISMSKYVLSLSVAVVASETPVAACPQAGGLPGGLEVFLTRNHTDLWDDVLIVTSETATDGGAVRVFDLRTGALQSSFSHPNWIDGGAGRPVAVDPVTGELWVGDDFHDLYRFDADNTLLDSFQVDVSCADPTGHGITNIAVRDDGKLLVAARWTSCTKSRVLLVDPATQGTLICRDLQQLEGLADFCANGIAVGPGPNGEGDDLVYVTESSSPGEGRIAVLNAGTLDLQQVITHAAFAGNGLSGIAVTSTGRIFLGSWSAGKLFKSTPDQTDWSVHAACGLHNSLARVALTADESPLPWLVYGPNHCDALDRFEVEHPVYPNAIDVSNGGQWGGGSASQIAIRH